MADPAAAIALQDAEQELALLTEQRRRFVAEFVLDYQARAAAIRAGYAPASARQRGHKLLSDPRVATAVRAVQRAIEERSRVTAEMVIAETAKIGFSDPGDVAEWGPDGVKLRDSTTLPERVRRAVKSVSIKRKRRVELGADGKPETWEIEEVGFVMHDKVAALNLLGKATGAWEVERALQGERIPLAALRMILAERERRISENPLLASPVTLCHPDPARDEA